MRHATVLELAEEQGVFLPDALTDHWPPQLSAADEKGWFRFQRLYDVARSVVTTESTVRRLVMEAAEDDAAEGSRWLEIQVDPSGYGQYFGGITPFLELVIDAAAVATRATGAEVRVVVAANRIRHPMDARTLARLAVQYAGRGVVGFGLSNDERRGDPHAFAKPFEIARRAGLVSVPHSGELLGAASVWSAVHELRPDRLGHGVRSAEDPRLLERIADDGITLEVCPRSNVALGVYRELASVPLRTLYDAGAKIALGADDPLLFGSRLLDQYEAARHSHGFTDEALADLARMSISGSTAPADIGQALNAAVDRWLDIDPTTVGSSPGSLGS
jgi:adenosine deaminase